MNSLHRLLALPVLALTVATANAGTFANINLDGNSADWAGITASATNTAGGPLNQIFLAHNDTYLCILVTFNTPINFLTDSFYIGIDNDSNTGTGWNIYSKGVAGSEVGYQGENVFQQTTGSFSVATTTNAPILASPYSAATTTQEFGIARTALIDTANSTLVFPNSSFNLVVYLDNGSEIVMGPASYNFAAVPEPATFAALAGFGALSLAFFRRRR
jgi:hypothetical protein